MNLQGIEDAGAVQKNFSWPDTVGYIHPWYVYDTSMKPAERKEIIVSVVTPSYNQGDFLADTIESVISQAGDFFLDYIVVDGGSTDNSLDILRNFDAELKSRSRPAGCRGISFRWTSEQDNGQADAVNKGFARATGKILGWLNSDDTYLPGAIARAVEYLERHPDDVMVYGNAYYTDKLGSFTGTYPSEPFSLKRLGEKCIVCQPAVFFRTEVLTQIGPLDTTLQASMDFDLWIRMGKRFEGNIAFLRDYLATSRMYPENKTCSLRTRVHKENTALVQKYFGYVGGEWIVSCFYDVMLDVRNVPLTRTVAQLLPRIFVLRYLLNRKALLSLGAYLRANMDKLFPHRS